MCNFAQICNPKKNLKCHQFGQNLFIKLAGFQIQLELQIYKQDLIGQ